MSEALEALVALLEARLNAVTCLARGLDVTQQILPPTSYAYSEAYAYVKKLREQFDEEKKNLVKENDALRAIATKIMPCHYCGAKDIARCPHGFPGCALADDIFCGEESVVAELRSLRDRLAVCEGNL